MEESIRLPGQQIKVTGVNESYFHRDAEGIILDDKSYSDAEELLMRDGPYPLGSFVFAPPFGL